MKKSSENIVAPVLFIYLFVFCADDIMVTKDTKEIAKLIKYLRFSLCNFARFVARSC